VPAAICRAWQGGPAEIAILTDQFAVSTALSFAMPRLVLAGLGHSHLFVLEAIRHERLPPCELVVCTGEAEHSYSGMVPGWIGGDYQRSALVLSVAEQVARAGGRLVPHHVAGLDRHAREVILADGSRERYDLCSIATGSIPTGMQLPGVLAHAIPLKPLGRAGEIITATDQLAAAGRGNIVVVGAGAAGVEVAFNLARRLRRTASGRGVNLALLSNEARPVAERGEATVRQVEQALARHCIHFRGNIEITGVTTTEILVTDGTIASDCTVWATGAAAPAWLAETGLPTDDRGFVLVNAALQSVGDEAIFAAGDAATLITARTTPKAGVYAVRMGPRLVASLARALRGEPIASGWQPQRRFLALLSTGDERAIASWGPYAAEGRWAMRLKDWIDRRFLARFSVGR
jgi:pyridine nucleotide-disulfide oxidoreductase family protein